jgi:CRP-like cAMP-binding protein
MLGGNDVGPRTSSQFVYLTFTLLMGAIVNAILFGNMGVMLESLNRKNESFQNLLETADEAMKNLSMPQPLMNDVKYYLSYTRSTFDHQQELDSFLTMISPTLRQRVTHEIFYSTISKNKVFKNQDEALKTCILPNLKIKLFMPEENIVRQSEEGKSIFFISRGECDVFVIDNLRNERHTKVLIKGDFFGEVAMLKNCKRTATVQSKYYSTCAEFDETHFRDLIDHYPSILIYMINRIRKHYNDSWKVFIKLIMANIDYLGSDVPNSVIDDIFYKLEFITISEGTFLFRKGNTCDCVYIIVSGELDIIFSNEKNISAIDTLGEGCNIGTYYSLTNEEFVMSGKAKSECIIMKLPFAVISEQRIESNTLNFEVSKCEDLIIKDDLPYCDYRLYRGPSENIPGIQKFKYGIKRIMRIVRIFKTSAFLKLLDQAGKYLKERREKNKLRRRSFALKTPAFNAEQKNDKNFILLTDKIENLQKIIEKQNDRIENLESKVLERLNILLSRNDDSNIIVPQATSPIGKDDSSSSRESDYMTKKEAEENKNKVDSFVQEFSEYKDKRE